MITHRPPHMSPQEPRAGVATGVDTNPTRAAELADDGCRVLILGDFGGRAAVRQPMAQRAILRLDRDGIDAAIQNTAPALRLLIDEDGGDESIEFRALDDFHPDRLLERVPTLTRLRKLRTTVESAPVSSAREEVPAQSGQNETLDGRSVLDRILESEEAPLRDTAPEATRPRVDDLSDFVRRAVQPHVAREIDPRQRAIVGQVDDVISATLRALLHHPEFQALEARWRAVDFFLRRCDRDGSDAVGLLDVSRDELALAASGGSAADRAALVQKISASDGGPAWSLVIAAYQFQPADAALLADLARIAEEMGAPWLSAADARLAGAPTFADAGDPDDWDETSVEGCDELRRERAAHFLGLSLPAFLVRLPYGADNSIESMRFEEFEPGAPAHDSLLWANPAFLCALIATAPVERGQAAPSHGTIGGLPLHLFTRAGTREAVPCAEALLSQRAAMHLLARGLTPLVSVRDGDAIRIPRLQSIAETPTPLPLRPTAGSR